jgi:DNA-binding CsgD family transcriptional regulator
MLVETEGIVIHFFNLNGKVDDNPTFSRLATLSARERDVFQMLADGKSSKEIASSLGISPKTVETHKCNLMRKLDIHNKAHLVHYAIMQGVVPMRDCLYLGKVLPGSLAGRRNAALELVPE